MLKSTLFHPLEVSIKCISCYVSTFHSFIVSKSKRSRKARAVADIKVYPGEMTCQKRSRDSDGVRGQREKDSQEVTRDRGRYVVLTLLCLIRFELQHKENVCCGLQWSRDAWIMTPEHSQHNL
ncbi:hypothetical protein J6590_061059 [Homalodisca vitripennis]|nr:hypothetical protein J6590_061059 [Homalodisca vitripennis]